MRIYSWNIRHGGGKRIPRIKEVIAGRDPDILVLPEFRNNPAGESLRAWLRRSEHPHQTAGATDLPGKNTVLLSAKIAFTPIFFPELKAESHRCVGAKFENLTVLAFYFPVMEAKRPVFKFIQTLPASWLKTPTLLIGDFNTGCRYWDEGRMDLSLVEEFGAVIGCSWVDLWRQKNPNIREWSWVEPWGMHTGYRLDHALASPTLIPRVKSVRYCHAERGIGMSDHSGLLLELSEV